MEKEELEETQCFFTYVTIVETSQRCCNNVFSILICANTLGRISQFVFLVQSIRVTRERSPDLQQDVDKQSTASKRDQHLRGEMEDMVPSSM